MSTARLKNAIETRACSKLFFSFTGSFAPTLWATITVPPWLSELKNWKITVLRAFICPTPARAAVETIPITMVFTIPSRAEDVCSTKIDG